MGKKDEEVEALPPLKRKQPRRRYFHAPSTKKAVKSVRLNRCPTREMRS